jgi:WD40 repeat protein
MTAGASNCGTFERKNVSIHSKKMEISFQVLIPMVNQFPLNFKEGRLYAGSGDGCLTTYDINMRKYHTISDSLDDDILSVLVMDNGQSICCGTTNGNISIFSTRNIWETSNSFKCEFGSMDCLLFIDENHFIGGSSNGEIHSFKMNPKRFLQKFAEHGFESSISKLSNSHDGKFISSCGEDYVMFWNAALLFQMEDEEEEKEENEPPKKKIRTNSVRNNFFHGFKE